MVEQKFNSERTLIGQGREASVYLWDGFAYKCFNSDYPKSLIDYEFKIQNILYNIGLPTVKYYETEIANSIKMDFIDGLHIGEKFFKRSYKDGIYTNLGSSNDIQNYEECLNVMLSLFSKIHSIKEHDIETATEKSNIIPYLNVSLAKAISNVKVNDSTKQLALKFISDIKDEKALCHMDYHFFNIMFSYTSDKYYIIDWMDAKLGNPIYDYARSYIIIYEFVGEFAQVFYDAVKNQAKFDELEFKKAIYVMAVHRLSESDSSKIKELINEYKIIFKQGCFLCK